MPLRQSRPPPRGYRRLGRGRQRAALRSVRERPGASPTNVARGGVTRDVRLRPTASGDSTSTFFLETFRPRCSGATRSFCCFRRAAAADPLHRLGFAPLTIRQGTPLHERVAFERSSLRQFYEQVPAAARERECAAERVTIRFSCSLRSATPTPSIIPLQHVAGMCSFGSDVCSTAERSI